MRAGGFILFTRQSDGGLNIITRHPRDSGTWHWAVSISPSPVTKRWWIISRDARRWCQWHDYVRLPFGKALVLSRQDYHWIPS